MLNDKRDIPDDNSSIRKKSGRKQVKSNLLSGKIMEVGKYKTTKSRGVRFHLFSCENNQILVTSVTRS